MEAAQNLLTFVKQTVEQDTSLSTTLKTGEDFEDYILSIVRAYCNDNNYHVNRNGKHSFPDLAVTFDNSIIIGLELKFSASGNWSSKGNSIFESITENIIYNEIYVLFGRKPKATESTTNIQIKYDLYGNAIDRIEVTHSPRFSINMNSQNKDLKDLFGIDLTYEDFRTKTTAEKNEFLRNYFINNKDKLGDKWYFSDYVTNQHEPLNIQPINFSKLDPKFRNQLIAEAFILFPNDLLKASANYDSVAKHFITQHFVYSSSLRDSFSAGGKTKILDDDILYPQMLKIFYDSNPIIHELLDNPPYENFAFLCYENWTKILSILNSTENDSIDFNTCSLKEGYSYIINNLNPSLEVKTFKNKEFLNDKASENMVKERRSIYLSNFFRE